MQKTQFNIATKYKNEIMKDWKQVVEMDKTSKILEHRQGKNHLFKIFQDGQKLGISTFKKIYKRFSKLIFLDHFLYKHKKQC